MKQVVFIDRDGTLVVDKDYPAEPEELEFFDGVPEALVKIEKAGFELVIVTNQSGVARGYFDETTVEKMHEHLREMLNSCGVSPLDIYYCPAHPEAKKERYRRGLERRKPAPGMLLEAAEEHDIELESSFMIGDKLSDVRAGRRAGCRSILVRTGKGESEAQKLEEKGDVKPDYIATALPAAVDWILRQSGS